MQTLFQAFQDAVKAFSERLAYIDYPTDRTYIYRDLETLVLSLIAFIQAHCPVKPGDRVGLLMSNQLEFITGFFALQALGAVVVPLNYRLSFHELEVIQADSGFSGLMATTEFKEAAQFLSPKLSWVISDQPWDCPDLGCLGFSLPAKSAENIHLQSLPALHPQALAVLIYTSGTTGKPKGVMLSHQNLLADAFANREVIACTMMDRLITCSPLFHVFGLSNIMLTGILSGASTVLVRRFNPKTILEAVTRHQVTFMAAVPTMYQMMLSFLPNPSYDLTSLRVCHSGAAPMAVTVFKAIESAFGAPVQEGYGQSESSSIITSNPLEGPRKPGSIGKPISGVTIEIVDEAGQEVPMGEIGELRVQADMVMLGYWDNPNATQKVLREGWLYTSDLGYRDDEGYLFLIGRRDDLINIGGRKVYPIEVEEVLYQHPAVESCAVRGVPSELYGQTIEAYIVWRPGQDAISPSELQKFCRSSLSDYKVPKAIYVVPEIPKGATGKILRHQLNASTVSSPS